MRIHTKLLLLLLVIALVPLVALSLRGQRATEALGVAIADRGVSVVSDEIESQLLQSVVYASDVLAAQQRQVELALRLQATELERRLNGPVPDDDVPFFTDQSFNSSATWPPDTELALDHAVSGVGREVKAVPISRGHQSFYVVKPSDGAAQEISAGMRQEIRRFGSMDDVYHRLSDTVPGLFYWQYVSLRDGLHAVFPGHGGYPDGFDPRARSWYLAAARSGALTWTSASLDAATRRLLLTASMPIYGADRQLAGVTGIDVDILSLLTAIQSHIHLGAQTASYIVRVADPDGAPLGPDGKPGAPTLRVVAASSYTDTGTAWDRTVDEPVLASESAGELSAMIRDLQNDRGGLRHMSRNGAAAVWAYGPIANLNMALVHIVAAQTVANIADQSRDSIWQATAEQKRLAAIASVGLMIVVAIISLVAAQSITEPLRQLAHVAKGLAAGRLDMRANINSSDEVGELAEAFNAMVPELQNHIKVKEGLALAHEVQQKLLPTAAPVLPGYDIAGLSIYSEDVGGDYYDFLELVDKTGARRVGVVVGDVTGHGVVAALTMTTVRVLLRSYAGGGAHLLPAMHAVNQHLAADSSGGRFVTLVYMVIDPSGPRRQLRWISAGQGPLLFYNMSSRQFEELAVHDIPLGVEADWTFHETMRDEWPEQGIVVIGTDGIWETQNDAGLSFGKDEFMNVIRTNAHLPAETICHALTERLDAFRGAAQQRDDVTLVIVKFV